jgi:malonyl-CoA O-methyltransferase
MNDPSPFYLDKQRIRQSFDAAAAQYDVAAVLQREVSQRLLERLELMRLAPEVIVDIGCGTGISTVALLKKYRKAQVIGLDIAPNMLALARKRTPWLRKLHCVCGDAEALPLADASCDLLFSNLTVQWCEDLDQTFREFRRVLRPGGLLLFSTLGPDTLKELRQSWQAVDSYNHVNAFTDMHDVGDVLVRAAYADPVMDMEVITLTYSDIITLMRDLKTLGAHNLSAGRPRNLTGKGRLRLLQTAYERFRRGDGRLPATYEVVYGHAWLPQANVSMQREDGVAVFPIAQLRRRP